MLDLNQSFLPIAAADERRHRIAADANRGGAQQRPERQRLVLSPRVVILAEGLDALRSVLLALDGAADDEYLGSQVLYEFYLELN